MVRRRYTVSMLTCRFRPFDCIFLSTMKLRSPPPSIVYVLSALQLPGRAAYSAADKGLIINARMLSTVRTTPSSTITQLPSLFYLLVKITKKNSIHWRQSVSNIVRVQSPSLPLLSHSSPSPPLRSRPLNPAREPGGAL